MYSKSWIRKTTGALFCASAVALVGCNSNQPPAPGTPVSSATAAMPASSAPAPASSAAQAAAPYTPPTADELYQLVAPIALFPDNLVAQVLAGSTYPDQITAADTYLAQNPSLKGTALQTTIAPQTWDPSVKGLTAFPSVLSQMAQNTQWTTSLGEAYVNDPTDVMNAIQVMRQRAAKQGNLRDSAQQRVVTQPVTPADTGAVADDGGDSGEPPVYGGPSIVQEPDQAIQIMPADPNAVYVPSYNPQTVYGEAVPAYPGYAYVQPAGYSTGDLIAVGAVSFGAAILVGSLFNNHNHYNNQPSWGWNNWGMHWGAGRYGNGGGYRRPAVVYNNSTYVSRSTTVVNRYTTNNYNNRTVNNNIVRNPAVANRNNFNNPGNPGNRNNPGNPGNRPFNNPGDRGVANTPQAMRNRPGAGAPASRPMTVPNFGTPVRGAEPVRNGQAGARPGRPAPTQGAARPNVPPTGTTGPRNGSPAGVTRDQVRNSPSQPAGRPANRPAQQPGATRPSAPNNATRPQTQRTPPASRPAAQTPPAARPAATRPQPQQQRPQPTQQRQQPAQRPQPQQRPQQQQRPQTRPQPAQRAQPQQQRPQQQRAQQPRPQAAPRAQPARPAAKPQKKNDKDGH